MNQKTILVTGATGTQGFSVAKALLAENNFKVRILTRSAAFPKAIALKNEGAEIFEGGLDDIESLKAALKDCYAVFGVTSSGETAEKEYQLGKNLIDEVAQSGVQHFVFSSLDSYNKLSGGQFPVPYFDVKAELKEYAKSKSLPATFVQMSFAYENFLSAFRLKPAGNGAWYFGFSQADTKMAAVSVEDYGKIVAAVFNHPAEYIGRTVRAVGDDRSCAEYAAILSKVLGRRIYFRHIPRDTYAAYDFYGAAEIANMFEVQRLYIPDRQTDLVESYGLNPATQSFENWITKNKRKFDQHFIPGGKIALVA